MARMFQLHPDRPISGLPMEAIQFPSGTVIPALQPVRLFRASVDGKNVELRHNGECVCLPRAKVYLAPRDETNLDYQRFGA